MRYLKLYEEFGLNEGTMSASEISRIKTSMAIELSMIVDFSELEDYLKETGVKEMKTIDDVIKVADSEEPPKDLVDPNMSKMSSSEASAYKAAKKGLNECYCSNMDKKSKRKALKEALRALIQRKKGLKPGGDDEFTNKLKDPNTFAGFKKGVFEGNINESGGLIGLMFAQPLAFIGIALLIALILILLIRLIYKIKEWREDRWCSPGFKERRTGLRFTN